MGMFDLTVEQMGCFLLLVIGGQLWLAGGEPYQTQVCYTVSYSPLKVRGMFSGVSVLIAPWTLALVRGCCKVSTSVNGCFLLAIFDERRFFEELRGCCRSRGFILFRWRLSLDATRAGHSLDTGGRWSKVTGGQRWATWCQGI